MQHRRKDKVKMVCRIVSLICHSFYRSHKNCLLITLPQSTSQPQLDPAASAFYRSASSRYKINMLLDKKHFHFQQPVLLRETWTDADVEVRKCTPSVLYFPAFNIAKTRKKNNGEKLLFRRFSLLIHLISFVFPKNTNQKQIKIHF